MAVAPDYVPLVVELADLLASDSGNLEEAETTGRQALSLLDRTKAPRRVAANEWINAVSARGREREGRLDSSSSRGMTFREP